MPGVWQPDQLAKIDVAAATDSYGDPAARKPTTVLKVFEAVVVEKPDSPALSVKKDDKWVTHTWKQYWDACEQFARALIHVGVQPHDAVNVLGPNCPEWLFTNMGTIMAGAIIAGVYGTSNAEACQYIAAHCDAKVVVVSDKMQLDKYLQVLDKLPELKALVVWTEEDVPLNPTQIRVPLYSFSDFLKLGKKVEHSVLQQRVDAQQPGHCCTLVYTSGTTGPPKAVMISHDNLTWTAATSLNGMPNEVVRTAKRLVSYLPLSHVAAQMMDIHRPMVLGAEVFFPGSGALRGGLVAILREVRPHIFLGVPRVWEKLMKSLQETLSATPDGISKSLTAWAMAQADEHTARSQYDHPSAEEAASGGGLGLWIADRLVLSNVRHSLGLDECKLCLSGAAATRPDVVRFFGSLNLPVYEAFGMSEGTAPHASNMLGRWKIGTVGKPLNGSRTRIDPDTGELQYTGRHVFMGYLNNEEATKKTLDDDGWLHSGDVGQLDADGFLRITGRIKELIITTGGENIPPVLVENVLKTELPALASVMVIGDKRKFLTFLCSLRVEMDSTTGLPSDKLDKTALAVAKKIGSEATTVIEAQQCDKIHAYIEEGMQRANAKAASRAQQVKKFFILPRDFSMTGKELTPTMKVKRAVVEKLYAQEIDHMYAQPVEPGAKAH